jgi:hypothetical protein
MDAANTFETPATYRALRAEYGLLGIAAGYLLWRKRDRVRWPVAGGLLLYNDLLGYIPGAIAYRRSPDGRVPRRYYVAYNVAHSVLTASAVAVLWSKARGPEWALLAIPLHIGIDRGFFGNFMRPFSVAFEPSPHPVWQQVRQELSSPWAGNGAATAAAEV